MLQVGERDRSDNGCPKGDDTEAGEERGLVDRDRADVGAGRERADDGEREQQPYAGRGNPLGSLRDVHRSS